MRAYTDNGLTFRDCIDPQGLAEGWVLFDHIPSDEEIAAAFPGYHDALKAKSLKEYDIAIERQLDAEAEAAGYYDPLGRIPNIDRACSYAGYTNPYQAEGQSFVAWRAAVWQYVYQVMSDVDAGNREQPTIHELISELPSREILD
jgi:hypothetical protein